MSRCRRDPPFPARTTSRSSQCPVACFSIIEGLIHGPHSSLHVCFGRSAGDHRSKTVKLKTSRHIIKQGPRPLVLCDSLRGSSDRVFKRVLSHATECQCSRAVVRTGPIQPRTGTGAPLMQSRLLQLPRRHACVRARRHTVRTGFGAHTSRDCRGACPEPFGGDSSTGPRLAVTPLG